MSTDKIALPDPPTTSTARLPSLTGMRWIAALLVFATHASAQPGILPAGATADAIRFAARMGGYIGVGFFFMLSGFVLTWSARPDDTAPKFWRRRFFKIYPNHLATFLLAIALMSATAGPIFGVVPNLLLVQAWSTDMAVAFGVNGVSWTLSVEALFYLCFPLVIVLVRRIRPERLWFWVGGAVIAVICVPLVARLLSAQPTLPWDPTTPTLRYWFTYVFPPVRALDFLVGVLLARVVATAKWPRVRLSWAAVVFVAGCAAASLLPFEFGIAAATVAPLALLILAAATADIQHRRSFLGSPAMVWLGSISFAFYLLHGLVLYGMYQVYGPAFVPDAWESAGIVALALAVTTLLAWGLYSLVERPVQRRFSVSPRDRAR